MKETPREQWGSQVEYLLSCLGYAVGIGNVWRFPYLCYRNGGGAFLIPYFLTLIVCGIPLVYLETTLGQFASAGCISVFNINPLFKGAGYAVVVLTVVAVTYFSTIMALPILYMYHSLTSPLPWQHCGNRWNTEKCTEISSNSSVFNSNGSITTPEDEFFHIRLLRMSSSISDIGAIVWPVFWCNLIGWMLVYFCICNGVKSVGKVWADAATQIFYSLGPGWGGLVSMASFNKFNYDNLRPSVTIALVNSATSIWAGFVVFSVLGFAADRTGVPVSQVATAGPGLAFVTYPAVVTMMPAANFWSLTFFVMLFFLGIDTMFVTIEAVIAGFLDEFPQLRRRKRWVTLVTCLILFCLSIICNTEGGFHVLTLLDSHVALAGVPVVCLLELIAAVYTYGASNLSFDVKFMTGRPLKRFWLVVWRYVVPPVLIVVTAYTMRGASGLAGWCVALVSVICIPAHAIRVIYQSRGSFVQRVRENCRPSKEWGPVDPDIRQRWVTARKHEKTKKQAISQIECYGHEQSV
ncbi:sodium- and chloride-dependent glycine transporter 1-like isoform X2 [Choristoneura fumiferana]|uniref:sodium- and chloride-dependent glycine transporter 1-like isoform X2 n=1 Tax=Choristoneura fumiferana TaxID=7141 RepID=UPI003D15E3B9